MTSYRTRSVVILAMIAASMSALATNPPSNSNPSADADADASALAASSSNATGVGLGVGIAGATGGDALSISASQGGDGFGYADSDSHSAVLGSGNSSVLDVTNTAQGQEQSNANTVDASSANDNANSQSQSSASDQHQTAKSSQGQSMNYTDGSKYISLSLPGATADPGTTAACTESRRGWTFAGFGASGRTRINADCAGFAQAETVATRKFAECMTLADVYFRLGAVQSGINQLGLCGATDVSLAKSEVRQLMESSTRTETTTYVTKEQLDRAFAASQAK